MPLIEEFRPTIEKMMLGDFLFSDDEMCLVGRGDMLLRADEKVGALFDRETGVERLLYFADSERLETDWCKDSDDA